MPFSKIRNIKLIEAEKLLKKPLKSILNKFAYAHLSILVVGPAM